MYDPLHPLPLRTAKPLPIPNAQPPPLPPQPDTRLSLAPPPPPPKRNEDPGPDASQFISVPSYPSDSAPPTPLSASAPSTPSSLTHPTGPAPEGKAKKTNPLVDLIETEKIYVDQLAGIIRKVASAWSRSNLPPRELDYIFRSIEGVYKANRSLLAQLKEIGTNPPSPKALGDLLMRWTDDLDVPYTSYCTQYCTGFDVWEPIQTNERLKNILATFSASNPPPPSLISDPSNPTWTLDSLFVLPQLRLNYYKKLYSRLQKSTSPGKSDHRLLIGALEKLDMLLATAESREHLKVGTRSSSPPIETEDEVVVEPTVRSQADFSLKSQSDTTSGRDTNSTRGSSVSSGERPPREHAPMTMRRGSTMTITMPISDLERRVATERTLDVFTMNPKVVRLQIAPPTLPFDRQVRFSADVVIRLTPRSTGVEVIHHRGHVFLLTDLCLLCERMSPEERAQYGSDGPDMWLCYPPLAGKVLRVSEVNGQDNALQISILRKENLIFETESVEMRNVMLTEFRECIDFAGSMPPPQNQLQPSRPDLQRVPSTSTLSDFSHIFQPGLGLPPGQDTSLPGSPVRASPSPAHGAPNRVGSGGPYMPQQQGSRPSSNPDHIIDGMANLSVSSEQNLPPLPQVYPNLGPGGPPFRGGQPPANQYPGSNMNFPPGPLQPGYGAPQWRPPSSLSVQGSASLRSFGSQHGPMGPGPPMQMPYNGPPPPMQVPYNGPPPPGGPNSYNTPRNAAPMHAPQPRSMLPSAQMNSAAAHSIPSPPGSPTEEGPPTGPVTSTISAQMKCKVFLQQHHAQWKSLGAAKLKLYLQQPTNVKQLVVEADNRGSNILISTIVLTDGVERVGKTGVAVELSDKGTRTGIIYMIQLRNETSAGGLYDSLLAGSDRAGR